MAIKKLLLIVRRSCIDQRLGLKWLARFERESLDVLKDKSRSGGSLAVLNRRS
jgi:hypothetical protein